MRIRTTLKFPLFVFLILVGGLGAQDTSVTARSVDKATSPQAQNAIACTSQLPVDDLRTLLGSSVITRNVSSQELEATRGEGSCGPGRLTIPRAPKSLNKGCDAHDMKFGLIPGKGKYFPGGGSESVQGSDRVKVADRQLIKDAARSFFVDPSRSAVVVVGVMTAKTLSDSIVDAKVRGMKNTITVMKRLRGR